MVWVLTIDGCSLQMGAKHSSVENKRRDYALFLFLRALMEQIRTFVAKRAMSGIRAFLVLFGLQFDSDISDLTSGMPALPALWQHRLPCGRVVVEHEMCGYCGPISLKILWSPPPETEGAIRK